MNRIDRQQNNIKEGNKKIQNGGCQRPMGAKWRSWQQFIGVGFCVSWCNCDCTDVMDVWMDGITRELL